MARRGLWILIARSAAPAIVVCVLLLVTYYRSLITRMAAGNAQETSPYVQSDRDMLSIGGQYGIIGPDYVLCDYIFRNYPVGTHVHVEYSPGHGSFEAEMAAGRLARFYLALLPQYPDLPPYTLSVRLKKPRSDDEDILIRGELLELVQRRSPQGVGR